MLRRDFLKRAAALVGAAALPPLPGCDPPVYASTPPRMREEGFYRKILPPPPVEPAVAAVKTVLLEDSPSAISIPFDVLPINTYIRGERKKIVFDRIVTPRFVKYEDQSCNAVAS